MLPSDDPTAIPLHLIHELTTLLQAAQIPHWLFGGWVVDFVAGEITRPHSDVDLILWRRDAPGFRELLARYGYAELPSPSGPELDARFRKQGVLIEIMFVHEQEDGTACWDHWHLPEGSLEEQYGRVGQILCPIVSPQTVLRCKEAYLRQPDGPTDRDKHLQDVARLRVLVVS